MRPTTDVRPTAALVVIAAATLLVILDSTIVTVALPAVQAAFDMSPAGLEWVSTAYAVTFGGLLLLGGRSGDLYGRRRMFTIGVGLFGAASLLGALAPGAAWLIACRALQGVGAAIAAPTALALIATTFPDGRPRHRAMAVYATMSSFGGIVGLVLGGLLVHTASWRWVFLAVVPISAAVLVMAPRTLPETAPVSGRLDVPGAVTATGGAAALVYGLVRASQIGWTAVETVSALVGAVVLLAAFVAIERRVALPLLPLGIVTERKRATIYAITGAVGLGLYAVSFHLMLHLQHGLGLGPLAAGTAFLPMALAIGCAATAVGRLVTRTGTRIWVTIGPALAAVGLGGLGTAVSAGAGLSGIVPATVLLGLGLGASFVPLTLSALGGGLEPRSAGAAAALVGAGQQLGGAVGIALLGTVAAAGAPAAFFVAAAVLGAAFLLSWLVR